MLKYRLMKTSKKEILYEYYPEGSDKAGRVSFDLETNECGIIELAENDRHQRYALKVFKKLREFASNDSFETEGIVAWY